MSRAAFSESRPDSFIHHHLNYFLPAVYTITDWLMILLAIPGFALWGGSYFGYKLAKAHRTAKVEPLIEAKYDEAYQVCEKAQKVL